MSTVDSMASYDQNDNYCDDPTDISHNYNNPLKFQKGDTDIFNHSMTFEIFENIQHCTITPMHGDLDTSSVCLARQTNEDTIDFMMKVGNCDEPLEVSDKKILSMSQDGE